MITGIRHIGLVVANLEKSLDFWCNAMGFNVVRKLDEYGPHIDAMMGLKSVRVTTAKLSAPDGNLLELLQFHSHPDRLKWEGTPYTTGLTHIALAVKDLSETCQRLKKLGVSFPSDPQISPDGAVKVIYASAPDGVLLELVEVINEYK